ncbi:MAG: YdcF family protein [Azoarcus sp.]|jgi:uncharacterized SAM-binding protein YcdF (DUF218 family)|nr:YdcF family protein [Azoarcus sp.]
MGFSLPLFLFWLKKGVSALILPPLLPFVLVFAGLVFIQRRWRGGFALAWLGAAIGVLTITPVVVDGMLAPLEPAAPLRLADARDAQAIVILGGGRVFDAPEYGGDTVSFLTLERLRYGARLARETGLPVLVSGGSPGGGRAPEALLMKAALEEDFHTPVSWTEENSLDTRQNAVNSAALLKAAGIGRIVLVTHAAHMRRAREEFVAQGLNVTEAPTAWLNSPHNNKILPALPNPGAAYAGWFALHEWLGLLASRLSR